LANGAAEFGKICHGKLWALKISNADVNVKLQVCEVYKMHRETLYMCVDYVDRFLSRTTGIKKSQLQLIGITALFTASKMEVSFGSGIVTT